MNISKSLREQICTHELIFFSSENKVLVNINGRVRKDETAVVIWPKPKMRFYGAQKMVCANNGVSANEYRIIGIDRDSRLESQNNPQRPYVIFITKN